MPNWPAVSVPTMTQRGPRPTVASLKKPISLAMLERRENMEPEPPAPALFTLDSSVSAGCEMMAAATPAITPETSETATFCDPVIFSGVDPTEL